MDSTHVWHTRPAAPDCQGLGSTPLQLEPISEYSIGGAVPYYMVVYCT
jgi:hypothetical protein